MEIVNGGATYSWSCDYKDIRHRISSCPSCVRKLEKGISNDECCKCWNWDFDRAKHSETLVDSVGGYVKTPRKLYLELQHSESKQIYQDLVGGKLDIGMEKLQLNTLCLTGGTIYLIVDCAIVRNTTNTCALFAHELNKIHSLIDLLNLHGIGYPDFVIHKRKFYLTMN